MVDTGSSGTSVGGIDVILVLGAGISSGFANNTLNVLPQLSWKVTLDADTSLVSEALVSK